MDRSLGELESIVRKRICGICSERNAEGGCGLERPAACALFRLFLEVVWSIESVQGSKDLQPYADAIRRNVCSVCADRESDGSCRTRAEGRCALDAYLVPIVEAIEEARLSSPNPV